MALIALPSLGKPLLPPLTLAYIAALLEQRRHIVRIYDLALDAEQPLSSAFQPLRSFRPQVVVVAGDRPELLSAAVEALRKDQHHYVLPIQMNRNSIDANHICAGVLQWIESQRFSQEKILPSPSTRPYLMIDELPFPARHLLSLESYELRAVGGELQTTLLLAGLDPSVDGRVVLRSPTQIVAELRSVSHEFGLRHYLFGDVSITSDRDWLVELLTRLHDSGLNIGWEANADADQLDEQLSVHMAKAGCEALMLHIRAASVFESADARARVRHAVTTARENGIFVRGHVRLEPPYESVPHLVDVAATFNLDDVRFDVVHTEAESVGTDGSHLQEMARQIYDAGRDRQRFISRFGPTLGNLIWKLRGPRNHVPSAPATTDLDDEGAMA